MTITEHYNRLGFLAPIIVEICDNLEETTACQRQLKYHVKNANLEAQKVLSKHSGLYHDHGEVEQPDGAKINTQDIYNITSKSYDFLFSKKPHEIASIASMVQQMDEAGTDYTKIDIPFKPLV